MTPFLLLILLIASFPIGPILRLPDTAGPPLFPFELIDDCMAEPRLLLIGGGGPLGICEPPLG